MIRTKALHLTRGSLGSCGDWTYKSKFTLRGPFLPPDTFGKESPRVPELGKSREVSSSSGVSLVPDGVRVKIQGSGQRH